MFCLPSILWGIFTASKSKQTTPEYIVITARLSTQLRHFHIKRVYPEWLGKDPCWGAQIMAASLGGQYWFGQPNDLTWWAAAWYALGRKEAEAGRRAKTACLTATQTSLALPSAHTRSSSAWGFAHPPRPMVGP